MDNWRPADQLLAMAPQLQQQLAGTEAAAPDTATRGRASHGQPAATTTTAAAGEARGSGPSRGGGTARPRPPAEGQVYYGNSRGEQCGPVQETALPGPSPLPAMRGPLSPPCGATNWV